jgi:hypothetical protein
MSFLNTSSVKCGLVIGINYENDGAAKLNGCIEDTKNIVTFLKNKCGYQDSDIQLLTDNTAMKPTKQNIINSINMLVKRVKETQAKEVWFSYSGHGSYLSCYSSVEEKDNQDEALVPLDYNQSGLIRDDVLYEILVKQLPLDCHLFSIIDACHSGTALDLPYLYRLDSGVKEQRQPEKLANIFKLSGCRDNQTSADAYIQGKYQGALTFSFLKCMDDLDYNFTPKHLVQRCKHYLSSNNYPQIPTLSFSNPEYLDKIIMGDGKQEDNNINLYLEGDSWCNSESSWNIMSLQENRFIFSQDQRFYARNEKINYQLNLSDGRYILVLKDSYGDGGITGSINYLRDDKLIKTFNFSSGNNESIDFTVSSSIQNSSKKEILFMMKGDYYAKTETSWNVIDSAGKYLLTQNKAVNNENKDPITILLEPGLYYLKCMDSYGDGGLQGSIICKKTSKLLLKFEWVNLQWDKEEGYQKYYKFIV